MKISIDNSLHLLKNYLEGKGYEVHYENENVASDVYIYSSKSNNNNVLENRKNVNNDGCLIIDENGKSLNEIEYIIKHRSYSSLFF